MQSRKKSRDFAILRPFVKPKPARQIIKNLDETQSASPFQREYFSETIPQKTASNESDDFEKNDKLSISPSIQQIQQVPIRLPMILQDASWFGVFAFLQNNPCANEADDFDFEVTFQRL